MARAQNSGSQGPGGTEQTVDKTAQPAASNKMGFLSRLLPSRVDRPAEGSANGKPSARSGFGRLLFGMLIFIVGANLLETILFVANNTWKLNLLAPLVSDKNTPILGGMTRFTLIYVIVIVALYAALYRFNIFPKDPFGVKAQAAERARRNAGNQQNGATSAHASRSRAARRHAASTTARGAQSTRRAAANARTDGGETPAPGEHDSEYERVKAIQRMRRRREARR